MATYTGIRHGKSDSAGTSQACDASISVSVGQEIQIGAGYEGGATTTTISDGLGNTYTELGSLTGNPGEPTLHLFIGRITNAGTATFTANFGASRPFRNITAHVFTPASGYHFANDSPGYKLAKGSSAAPSSGSWSIAGAGIASGIFKLYNATASGSTPGSGWTETQDDFNYNTMYAEYQLPSASGSLTANFTWENNDEWVAGGINSLEVADSGGGISGTASITEAADTLASTGTIKIQASLSVTGAGDTLASTGTVALKGSASITEADDTTTATGTLKIVGSLSATEADDTLAAAGIRVIGAVASITEADDTVAGTSTLAIKASAAITESDDTSAATGTIKLVGTLSVTEDADTLVATGAAAPVSGAADITEAGDTLVSSGTIKITASVSATEDGDTLAGIGALVLAAVAALTEEGDTLAATGTVASNARSASLDVTEEGDTLSSTATITLTGSLSVTEQDDTLAGAGSTSGYLIDGSLSYHITTAYGKVSLYNNGADRYFTIG